MFALDSFTIIVCLAILVAIFMAWRYVARTEADNVIERHKWLDQLPSMISTLGVLGTFLGITKGLLSFDTSDLDASIPLLLDGLKTAFFTSLLGMAGSLILNRAITKKLKELGADDSLETLAMSLSSQSDTRESVANAVERISADMEQLKDDIEEIKMHVQSSGNGAGNIEKLTAVTTTATASISAIDNCIEDIKTELKEIKGVINELQEEREE